MKGKGIASFDYWTAVLTGTGRGTADNDDDKFMYFGRFQWNFLGRDLSFTGCDIQRTPKPAGIIAINGVTNTSPYTRFSTSGGGSLEGHEDGVSGQYTINQLQVETSFVYKGLSWNSEFHRKQIEDNENFTKTMLGGYYFQLGYFPSELISFWPEPLEIAVRFARYMPDMDIVENNQNEFTCALNWFFAGHKNKLTAEITRFVFNDETLPQNSSTRYRVQYDISF